ncbi:YceH family protein [Desulfoprunum benzoelyticum]|uniref:Uncharacterized protein n=1 Tax=Desulfoprunum benzoelyticum TaxID=1506996 RepID=A0A840UUX9_9BACT|nr:YceH family protein [Desulfoprunum benzoelyticum]MBB5349592.1 hypothetical protein [Desulfoprunum benzoelyticum]MBM9531496.1 YceH family protein [Desulfoprunum benzoelyticum]
MNITLNGIEIRVLGSLIEKELATPEYYPLSLNALANACNQKSNRSPVLSLNEDDIINALQSLKDKQIVCRSDATRVPKYWHNFVKQHNLIRREAALLCLLLLRGQQTAGELRSRTERLCSFESLEEVVQSLDSLLEIGFVRKLPRQPGQKEQRYSHLLAEEPEDLEQLCVEKDHTLSAADKYDDRISALENSVAYLKEELETLKDELLSFKKGKNP